MASANVRRWGMGNPDQRTARGSSVTRISQASLRPITSSGGPSRRWQSGMSASGKRPRRAGIRTTGAPQEAVAPQITRPQSPARMARRAQAWAKLMARVGEEFPLACPTCGGDIRLIAFRLFYECETIPGLRTLGNLRLLRTSCPRAGDDPEDSDPPPPAAQGPARLARPRPAYRLGRNRAGPLSTATSFRRRIDELPVIDIHSLRWPTRRTG